MRYRIGTALIALVVLGLLVLPPAPCAAGQERTFIFVTQQELATLDPHIEINNPPKKVFEVIYEPLLDYDLNTLEVTPHLAQSWSLSSDGLQYTFRLRRNVRFHDGTAMDAEAVRYSFDRMKRLGLGYAFVLDPIKSVDVVDRLTVRITLSAIGPTFIFGIPLAYIVSPTAITFAMAGDAMQDALDVQIRVQVRAEREEYRV